MLRVRRYSDNHLSVLEITLNLVGYGSNLLAVHFYSLEMVPDGVQLIWQLAGIGFDGLGLVVRE